MSEPEDNYIHHLETELAEANARAEAAELQVEELGIQYNEMNEQHLDQIEQLQEPVPMILCCPECGEQHIDRVKPDQDWENPPHRTHQCDYCGHHWRPSDRATTGVAKTETLGKTADQGGAIFKTAKYQAALIKQLQEQLENIVLWFEQDCEDGPFCEGDGDGYALTMSSEQYKQLRGLVDRQPIPPTDLVPWG